MYPVSPQHANSSSSRHTPSVISHSNTGSEKRKKTLPPHVDEVLHARRRIELPTRLITAQGLHSTASLMTALDRKLKTLPWEKKPVWAKDSSEHDNILVRSRSSFIGKGKRQQQKEHPSIIKRDKLREIVDKHPYGKITFKNLNDYMEVIPNWVTYRLEDSCRNARFTLPSDYTTLAKLTPMDYLKNYVVLSHTQRRRYDKIYNKFVDKVDKYIKYEKLFPAISSMFTNNFGEANFRILVLALLIHDETKIGSRKLFAGICAFAERLFWSSYIESEENTFFMLGPNRSVLECADFNGLKWKLEGVDISYELKTLLFSLA